MTIIIQAVESEGRSGGQKFAAVGFAGKKSPDLAFSNVDRYENCNNFEVVKCSCTLCRQSIKFFLAIVQIEKSSPFRFCNFT